MALEGTFWSDAFVLRKILIIGYCNHSVGFCMEELKVYKIIILPVVSYGYES
jgi:hypothetical protein